VVRPQDAAVAIARRFGVVVTEPVTLSDSNNVVVWLRPSPVVAKVATGQHRRPSLELSVAQRLASCGAPVVGLVQAIRSGDLAALERLLAGNPGVAAARTGRAGRRAAARGDRLARLLP
jgi:hypothetical protein